MHREPLKERVAGRNASCAVYPKDLTEKHMAIAGGVVGAGASAVAEPVAAAVADAHVEVAVAADLQVAAVVVAVWGGEVVD